eukprot:IDg17748t1
MAAKEAEVAINNCALVPARGKADLAEAQTDAGNKSPLTRVWEFFSFTESQRKKLPPRADAEEGVVDQISPAWYTLVQSDLTAATRVAEGLYPGNVQGLLLAVASKIRGSERPGRELKRAADRIAEVMLKAPKNSVKLGGWSDGVGYEDYNKMTQGEVLVPEVGQDMYHEYVAKYSSRISRGSFYKLASAITHSSERLLTAIDYVAGVLVHDTTEILQDMVDAAAPNPERKEDLT